MENSSLMTLLEKMRPLNTHYRDNALGNSISNLVAREPKVGAYGGKLGYCKQEYDLNVVDYSNVIQRDDHFEFRMVVPGLDEESLEISFHQPDTLKITGSYTDILSVDEELEVFSQSHVIMSPVPIDPNAEFTATYDKGILKVLLPLVKNAVVKISLPKTPTME